ncbi:MAG TPA: NADPH:quinone oxidoreductase family protein [Alphaproteobacteria bacterium]|nr:NADPH:quinone oxidoreductase family protein [Alphaproteobacteria bacterium]
MRAMLCTEWGGPDTLKLQTVEPKRPGEGQLRIAIKAAGLNFADTLMIAGKYQERPDFPFSPGLEGAGEVIECGPGVTGFEPGTRVMAMLGHGGFAEEAITTPERVFAIPDAMPYADAAGFPVAYGTSHVALRHRAHLEAGETLLVHGAAGGVGLTAVEIGTVMGATVIASASSAEKLALAKQYGAQHGIDYSTEDIRERVLEITGKRGADVIYDPVGGDVFDTSLRCIAWEGRLLVIGFAAGRIPEAPANYLLLKNCSAVGVFWGGYMKRNPAVIRRSFDELLGWYEAGKLKPHVSATYELADAATALKAMIARKTTGKIVLTME